MIGIPESFKILIRTIWFLLIAIGVIALVAGVLLIIIIVR